MFPEREPTGKGLGQIGLRRNDILPLVPIELVSSVSHSSRPSLSAGVLVLHPVCK